MADVVQYRLERMSDELDDLERRGLFSRPEIAEIVRRRRDFEYRLKRPSPLKQDFLAYIDYEKQVDALRNLRKRAILGEIAEKEREQEDEEGEGVEKKKKKKSKKWKKSISDIAGVLRILDIYRMATVRYKADLDLWFKYLEFCRLKKHGRMKQVLAQAIRYHPKVPGLWIYAAAWEFDQNLNVAAARALMQSGLRSCPTSEDLWIEYLRMELTYLNKLKARKVALGEDVKMLQRNKRDDDQWKEENKDLFMPLKEEQGSNSQEGDLEKGEELFLQQGALVLQTIYHGAIEAIPSSLSLRQRFLEILDVVDLANYDELKIEAMEDLKKNFSHDESYWDWIARLQIGGISNLKDLERSKVHSKLDRVVQVYEEALNVLPTAKMFSLSAKFWLDMMAPDGEDSVSPLSEIVNNQDFVSSIIKVFEKAESSGCLTSDLACQYLSFYLQIGGLDEARNLAKKLCSGKLSGAANLWILRSTIEIKWFTNKSPPINKDDMRFIFEFLKDVLTRLSISDTERLWLMALKVFSNNKGYFERLVKVLIVALGKVGGSYSGASVSSAVVNWVHQREGIQRARDTYKRFLSLPHPSVKLFRHCIELEANLGFLGDSCAIKCARKLYESALCIYPENRELWRDYYLMEKKVGTSESANAVYWRAKKIFKDTTLLNTDL
ncbi:hypothetical protein Cni_G19167 [Canna indica]|uniref:U3 small nucleolar RNA-associated protein 6 n=1 Tax=Canna indica TaxID=4628 RepID=A0AAQ3KR13_9LILI|nr:hypothetical protein Cni_G19167 [Canna indica]